MKNSRLNLSSTFPIAGVAVRIDTNSRSLHHYLAQADMSRGPVAGKETVLVFTVSEDKKGQYHFLCRQTKFELLIHNREAEKNWCVTETVKIISQYYLLKWGVLFLHASAIVHNGKGYVFAGYSGSGKTTVSGKVPSVEKIADDQVVLWKADGGYRIASSVFDTKLKHPNYEGVPLAKMFLITRSKSLTLTKPITNIGSVLSFLVNNDLFNAAFEFYLNRGQEESRLHQEIAAKLYSPRFKEKQFRLYLQLYKHVRFEELRFNKNVGKDGLLAAIGNPIAK